MLGELEKSTDSYICLEKQNTWERKEKGFESTIFCLIRQSISSNYIYLSKPLTFHPFEPAKKQSLITFRKETLQWNLNLIEAGLTRLEQKFPKIQTFSGKNQIHSFYQLISLSRGLTKAIKPFIFEFLSIRL